ncbi:PREDICTED: microtubule-associated protein 4 isoform X3 [Chinchilla lanigera]|uniref:microtubule-associated protein 4 isoform X3 n=1 Tax=Chinchilla lanigera TaxID=34839 RepID=UPI00038F01FE|nr:PREDICTED: microtubule-associated protein 4 isoform X3 [Chinchilla lanigera]
MADLSLADALTEPPPEIEEEIKRDFMATLEAEAYDDVVGETVGKTDYIPLMDGEEKTGNSESKRKQCMDTNQVEGTPSSKPTVLANGDHAIEGNNTAGSPTEFLDETMAYPEYQNSQNWPEGADFCFQPGQTMNPMPTDPFKMHHDDSLADLLFLSSGTTNAPTFVRQSDPQEERHGMSSCDTFAPATVAPQGWSVPAPNSAQSEPFVPAEDIREPSWPATDLAEEMELASGEEQPLTEALDVIAGQKTTDMAPCRETEVVLAKVMAPATETKVASAKDTAQAPSLDVTLIKDTQPSTESDTPLAKDMALPIEAEAAAVEDVILHTGADMCSAEDEVLRPEPEAAPGKEDMIERAPPTDSAPQQTLIPPADTGITLAKDVVSLCEMEAELAKDSVSSVEVSPAKEMALSSETEVALARDMVLLPEPLVVLAEDVALPLERESSPVKDMAAPPEMEMAPNKDRAIPQETEEALGKDVALPPDTEVAHVKDVTPLLEKEVASVKDASPPPQTEASLGKDAVLPPGTDVTLANNVLPAQDVSQPLETEVAPVQKDTEMAQSQEGLSEDPQLASLQSEGWSPAPPSLMSAEPIKGTSQKHSLPADEEPGLEKLEQKKPVNSQLAEASAETSGAPLTQGRQVCRPSDRRAARARPARVLPELPGGSSSWKTLEPRLGSAPRAESDWVSGSSFCGEPGSQKKNAHTGFLEPQRDLGREAWDPESTPVMMKKKKKKPKQKRYAQPQVGGQWDDSSADEPRGHPSAAASLRPGVLSSQSTVLSPECGFVARESMRRREHVLDSRAARQGGENFISESVRAPSCPEELPATAVSAEPKLRREKQGKDNSSVPPSHEKLPRHDEYKPRPAPHRETPVDKSQTGAPPGLKGPLTEVPMHTLAAPSEIRPEEGMTCSPVSDQKALGAVLKPPSVEELPNLTAILTASNPIENSLKEGNDESKMTNLQDVKQKEFSEEAREVKEPKREALSKPREEISIFASEQPHGQVLDQGSGQGDEPVKRVAGDGKSKKGRGSSGRVRAGAGKVRAKTELPLLLDGEKDGRAVLGPGEPIPKTESVAGQDETAGLGLGSSKLPGTVTGVPEAGVMGEPKELTSPRVGSAMQGLSLLENGSGLTQPSDANRRERGASVKIQSVSIQSKQGKWPWVDHESTPWISEKPRKRDNEGKTKKFKNNYPIQTARMEDKEEILNSAFVEKDGDSTSSISLKNKGLGLIFPKAPDPVFSHTSDAPTVEVVDRKGESVEVDSVELGAVEGSKTRTIKEPAARVTDVSSPDQTQVAGFVPSVVSEENKTETAKGCTAAADNSNNRDDGKNKKVKNSFPEKPILENKIDAAKIHVAMETAGNHRIEGMGYVDENRNITFTCPSTLSGLIKSATPETLGLATCEKLPPAPPVAKDRDSLPDTLSKSGQGRAPAPISKLLVEDNCKKDGALEQERPKAPSAVLSTTSTAGVVPTSTAALETVNSHGDPWHKNKGELDDPMKNEPGIDKGHVVGESELGHHDASKCSVQQTPDPAQGHLLTRLPADQSLPGEAQGLGVKTDRGGFPASPANLKQVTERGSVPAQTPDLLGDKTQKLNFSADQNAEDADSRDLENLEKETDLTLLPPKGEKDKSKEISLACKVAELECVSLPIPELHSSFSCGKVEVPPAGMDDKLVMTASKGLQLPELKDTIIEASQKMAEKSEPKTLAEGRREDKGRTTEPVKGYMRPTKSRGLTPPLPKSAVQERERPRQPKSSGIARSEEGKVAVSVTGNDISTPPNKELPPSPEKKTKPLATTQPAKTSTSKAKTQLTPVPKHPAPTTSGGSNKKPMSLASGLVPAAPPKRPAAATARTSTLPSRDTKPKHISEAKVPEKQALLSKPASALALRPGPKSSSAAPKVAPAAAPASSGPSSRNPPASVPKRPAAIKTEGRPADTKKTTVKSAPADLSRSRSTPTGSGKKTTTPAGAAPPAAVAATRVKPTPLSRPSVSPSVDKKPTTAKPSSSAPKLSRPATAAPAPDLKNVRSKVGSTENMKHQPGGGRAKVEKKTEAAPTARKPEPNAVTKTAGPIASVQKSPAGKVQIVSKKASYSHIQSKCGSKDNIKHVPGGGNVQIQSQKVDISRVSSKCGSKANIKHKPGGGDVKIESQKLNFKEKAQAKVGSLDNVGHLPAGGTVKIETYRLTFRANARARTDHGADIVSRPPHFPGSRALGSLSRAAH